jgi:hypothetical protein
LRRVMRHCNDEFLARWGSYSFPLPFCYFLDLITIKKNEYNNCRGMSTFWSDLFDCISFIDHLLRPRNKKKLKAIAIHQMVIRVRSSVTMFNRIRRYTNLSSL